MCYEWIQDCLSVHATPRKSREGPFLLKEMAKRERAAKKLRMEAKERRENDGVLTNELVDTSEYHLFSFEMMFAPSPVKHAMANAPWT